MALDLNDKDREELKNMMRDAINGAELKNMMRDAINESAPKETDDQRRARIMGIKNQMERQKAISENMDLFKGRVH